jgi:3-hydroxyisobutyrate dehydrogenase
MDSEAGTAGALADGATVAFIGLGNMGQPMARRLAAAGYRVRGYDISAAAREALAADGGGLAAASAREAADGAEVVVLMLPTSAVVGEVVIGGGLLDALEESVVLIDMGSSEPLQTRALAEQAARGGIQLIDAPVSGGVRGAREGSLTIMVGGSAAAAERCRPLFERLGRTIVHAGPIGAGHALKALNNLLSATHLLASCEAVEIGRRFGLDPKLMVDAINVSTGRSGSTERKLPDFILSERFDSGFTLALLAKDVGIAVALGEELGVPTALGVETLRLWGEAARALPADADHTEIARWVDAGEAAAG